MQIFRRKDVTTKFQVLLEIAAHQPYIQQKEIAGKLQLTPQAISEHVRELTEEKFILPLGRSRYRVTKEGVEWLLKLMRELREYTIQAERIVTAVSVSAALAEVPLRKGQEVGLRMKEGLLFAVPETAPGEARGRVTDDAETGEDVGIAEISGFVALDKGKVNIYKVAGIQRGGSRGTDLELLRRMLEGRNPVGAIGLEALVSLRKIGIEPRYFYGVREAAVEAAQCGLNFYIVCVEEELPSLIRRLEEEDIDYEIHDLRLSQSAASG